jgi:hypothetical protein
MLGFLKNDQGIFAEVVPMVMHLQCVNEFRFLAKMQESDQMPNDS